MSEPNVAASMKSRAGLARIANATRYSWQGLRAAYSHEAAFRQEVVAACVLIPVGLWIGKTGVERALLIASVMIVLVVEVLNSALEAVVDRISTDRHPLAGRAKDLGSAAVMLAIVLAIVVWSCVILG